MAVSDEPWGNFSDSDYQDAAALCKASLINLNDGSPSTWTKGDCKLRVYEPDGDLNRNGCHAAASVLAGGRGGVDAPPAAKQAAAKKLVSLYRGQLKEDPPDSIVRLAAG